MPATAPLRRIAAVVVVLSALLLAGCGAGDQVADVTGDLRVHSPSTLQIQVAQQHGEELTMASGGVGSGLLGTAAPTEREEDESYLEEVQEAETDGEQDSTMATPVEEMGAGRHVVIVDDSDGARVATGRLDTGVARLPGLADGSYTVALLEVTDDGWISGIGVVDLVIEAGGMTSAVPETHTRTLPVVAEQAQSGELIVNAAPSAERAGPTVSWRVTGPDGESSEQGQEARTTVDVSRDGEYTIEIRASLEGSPDVILQSVRYSFSVHDGQVGPVGK